MTEFCTSFSCRQRFNCKKALPLRNDLQAAKPYLHTNGYCTGYVPIKVNCVKPSNWFDVLFEWSLK